MMIFNISDICLFFYLRPLIIICFMLLRSLNRTRAYESVIKAAAYYKDSAAQKKMHEFTQNDEALKKAKQNIDYATI